MQTHTGREGGQVLRAWYSKLSIAKVSQASALCVTNYRGCSLAGSWEAQQGRIALVCSL